MLDLSITGRADALAILEQTASPCPTARLASLGPRSRFILRGGDEAVAAASAAFGVEIPREPNRAAVAGDRAALWLGPDEWVLVAGEEEGPAIGEALAAALAGIPHSLTDVSHRSVAFTLAGRHAATVLIRTVRSISRSPHSRSTPAPARCSARPKSCCAGPTRRPSSSTCGGPSPPMRGG